MAHHHKGDEQQRHEALLITKAIRAYARRYGCGDSPPCESCSRGVALGLRIIDRVFSWGYQTGKAWP
jgi:hypothetical protein